MAIGDSAFMNCTGLTNIVIPDSVTKIGWHAFSDCGLKSIIIPKSVKKIEVDAFFDCSSLKDLTILCPIVIDDILSYCTALETLTLGTGIKKINADNFEGVNLKAINVPAKKADYYKQRLPEELHGLIVELPADKKAKKK